MTNYHLGVNKPPEQCRPSTLIGLTLQQAIDKGYQEEVDSGVLRDLWIAGLEAFRVVAMEEMLLNIKSSDNHRVAISQAILNVHSRSDLLLKKFTLLVETVLPPHAS